MFPSYVPENTEQIVNQDAGFMTKKGLDVEEHNNTMVDLLRYGLPASAVGLFDDVLQSLTPDSLVNEETVTNMFDDLQHGLGAYYKENREGAQTAGALVGSFVPIIGATKLVRAGGFLDKILSNGGKTGAFLQKALISSGKTRTDRVMQMNAEAAVWFPKGKVLSLQDDGTQDFYRFLKGNQWEAAGDMAKEALAADAAIVTFFNDSDVFFPEDLSAMTNAALFLVPDALLTGLAYRFTGTAIKKQLVELGTEKAPGIPVVLADALNPLDLPQTDLLFREAQRGPAIATQATNAQIARADAATAGTNIELGKSGGQRLQAARLVLAEQFVKLFEDNPIKHGLTHGVT